MKKVIVIGIITVLIITLYIGCFTAFAEKKVWGKQNKVANEIAASVQNLYINVFQVLEKGLNEELGDPDVLGKFKDDISKKYNPELIPEKLEELENFASSFIDEIIDFHKYIEEGEWADPLFIEELKNKVLKNKPSMVIIPPSKVSKFQSWGIDYVPRINLGIEFVEMPLGALNESILYEGFFNKYKKEAGLNPAGYLVLVKVLPESPFSKAILMDDPPMFSDLYKYFPFEQYKFVNLKKGDRISVLSADDRLDWLFTWIDDQFIYSEEKLYRILDELEPGIHKFVFHNVRGSQICIVSAVIEESQYP